VPLKVLFSDLFTIVENKEISLADCILILGHRMIGSYNLLRIFLFFFYAVHINVSEMEDELGNV
jgi:hypothetical protein